MRPAHFFVLLLLLLLGLDFALLADAGQLRAARHRELPLLIATVAGLGLSDLAVATEARYTRHPAMSDPMAPFMDHPGAIEHFPTGCFWRPPPSR